jgi:sugar phosphate isomerase/epimerase
VGRRQFLKAASAVAASAAVWGADRALGLPVVPAPAPAQDRRRQYSLAYLTLYGCPPPEMTYIAGRAGYDFVSLRPIYMGLPGEPDFDLAHNAQLLRQTRTALASTGLGVWDIELARIEDGLDPRKYLPAMEVAAELGTKHVISSIWTADRVFATECFAQLCDLARPLGLIINLEFVTFAGVRTLQEALAVLRAARRENCAVLVDTLHFSRSRVRLEELDGVPHAWFKFVHLCDAPADIPTTTEALIRTAREERLYAGEGGIDLAGILRRLPDVPYSIEVPHLARVKELGYAEHAFRCLQTARGYVDARLHPRAVA